MSGRRQAKQAQPAKARANGQRKRAPVKRHLEGDGVFLYSAEEAANRLGIGRTLVYYLIGKGKIQSLKIEGLRRIPREALERYIAEQTALTSRIGA